MGSLSKNKLQCGPDFMLEVKFWLQGSNLQSSKHNGKFLQISKHETSSSDLRFYIVLSVLDAILGPLEEKVVHFDGHWAEAKTSALSTNWNKWKVWSHGDWFYLNSLGVFLVEGANVKGVCSIDLSSGGNEGWGVLQPNSRCRELILHKPSEKWSWQECSKTTK